MDERIARAMERTLRVSLRHWEVPVDEEKMTKLFHIVEVMSDFIACQHLSHYDVKAVLRAVDEVVQRMC